MAHRTKFKFTVSTDADLRIQVVRVDAHRDDGYAATGVGCALLTEGEMPEPISGVMVAAARATADILVFAPDPYGEIEAALRLAGRTMILELDRQTPFGAFGMIAGTYTCAVWA